MSDLFHEDVPFEFIAAVFGVMAACPPHTFQVLTKRPERALAFFEWIKTAQLSEPFEKSRLGREPREVAVCAMQLQAEAETETDRDTPGNLYEMAGAVAFLNGERWPLKNVWLGVSVATQADADKNIPVLLKCPAAIRFLSAEPLIGAIDLHDVGDNPLATIGCEPGEHGEGVQFPVKPDLDWVIVGGESGPGARPFDIAWARTIVEQCKAAGVPVFVKQLGTRAVEWNKWENRNAPLFLTDRKGGDPSEWPEDLRVREFPRVEVRHA